MGQPLNQILYGPPGTGKTYNTIFKALDILVPLANGKWEDVPQGTTPDAHRKNALLKFNQRKDEGRIVFTTFHQSMSYEDFVEGIKPDVNENGDLTYTVVDGILKKMIHTKAEKIPYYGLLLYWLQTCIKNKTRFPQKTSKGFIITGIIGDQIVTKSLDNNSSSIVYLPLLQKLISDNVDRETTVKDLSGKYQKVSGVTCRNTIDTTEASYYRGILAKFYDSTTINSGSNTSKENEEKQVNESVVLIVDEINRGNVANIFGELITLIEDDKRTTKWDENERTYVDNPEGMKVKLPYSGDEFGVPGNLYIIGTMNTADRSVEALDSALRRRFTFEEMMPKPELLKDVKISGVDCVDANGKKHDATLADFLYTINRRIEVLKDCEHQIGHSYFMQFVDNQPKTIQADALKDVIYKKVIPLLQEYFYGDYEKIQLVLGNDIVKVVNNGPRFPKGLSYSTGANLYKIEDSNNVNFVTALNDMDLMQCP